MSVEKIIGHHYRQTDMQKSIQKKSFRYEIPWKKKYIHIKACGSYSFKLQCYKNVFTFHFFAPFFVWENLPNSVTIMNCLSFMLFLFSNHFKHIYCVNICNTRIPASFLQITFYCITLHGKKKSISNEKL